MSRWFAVILVLVTGAWAGSGFAASLSELRVLALELVNRERQALGLPTLETDPTLDATAQRHAEDMLARNYFDHSSPEGDTVLDRFIAEGGNRWLALAENIARCTGCAPPPTPEDLAKTHQGWMESPGHRENILNPTLRRFGFGLAAGADGRQYSVQTFSGPGGGGVTGERLTPAQQQSASLVVLNADRRRGGLAPLQANDSLQVAARRLAQRLMTERDAPALRSEDLRLALPEGDRRNWREVTASVVACGGCGVAPSEADISRFRDRWIAEGAVVDPRFSHAGVAILADGEGRKVAVAVFGRRS